MQFKASPHQYKPMLNYAQILNKIIFHSLRLLLWVNVTLDIICIGFEELRGNWRKRNIQNESIFKKMDLNYEPLAPIEF